VKNLMKKLINLLKTLMQWKSSRTSIPVQIKKGLSDAAREAVVGTYRV
jgi:hypothetical protein